MVFRKRRAGERVLVGFGLCALVAACGSDGTPDATSAAGASSLAGGAGELAAGAPGAGSPPTAGAPAAGASNPGAGSGGSAANGGDPLGAAGSGVGGSSSGAGGAASGAAGQMPGSAGSVSNAAAVLDKYQLLDPCDLSNYKVEAAAGAVCPQTNAVKNQHVTLTFGGEAALTYDVTLHVRGIMEHYWYAGGTLDPVSKTFYTGGVPTVGGYSSACKNKTSELPFALPTELSPTDNCFNGFNVFALAVSAPKTHYYLNYTTDKASDRPPHAVYKDDYTVTIPIQGQAKLDFYIIGSDEHQCYNHKDVLSGVMLSSSPYIGEFVQFDVTKVAVHQ
ncbi:MAG: hypothetical protein ABUL62_24130 [Myxococcales bacterium]